MAHYLKGQTVTMTDDISLFDGLEIPKPPMIGPDDTARARRADSLSSHEGADVSAANRRLIMDTVFGRLLEHPSADYELEAWYADNIKSLPSALPGSPRKRRSDLAKQGLVVKTVERRRNPQSGVSVPVWGVAL